MRRKPILTLIKGLGIGGAERLLAAGAPFWDQQTFDYHVAYVLPWKDQLAAELRSHGIQVHQIGGLRGGLPRAAMELRRLVRDIGAQVVHAHLPLTGFLARLACRVPIVYTEHNVVESYREPTRTINRLTYRCNTLVIAVSDEVAASVRSYRAQRLVVIPNGVSPEVSENRVNAVRDELGLGARDQLVVHVGNIRPHKGHETLIAAASILLRDRPRTWVVSIGGEKRPGDLTRLRGEAANARVGGRLMFLGRRSDALAFIAAADVVVNPSDFEGLPVALLEAMALGRPIVATRVGGVGEIVRHLETGTLVEPRDASGLASAISLCLDDPARAEAIANNGQRLVADRYGLERMVRATEEAYRQILTTGFE